MVSRTYRRIKLLRDNFKNEFRFDFAKWNLWLNVNCFDFNMLEGIGGFKNSYKKSTAINQQIFKELSQHTILSFNTFNSLRVQYLKFSKNFNLMLKLFSYQYNKKINLIFIILDSEKNLWLDKGSLKNKIINSLHQIRHGTFIHKCFDNFDRFEYFLFICLQIIMKKSKDPLNRTKFYELGDFVLGGKDFSNDIEEGLVFNIGHKIFKIIKEIFANIIQFGTAEGGKVEASVSYFLNGKYLISTFGYFSQIFYNKVTTPNANDELSHVKLKNWKIPKAHGNYCEMNFSGGLYLNGILLKNSLMKTSLIHKHKLEVGPETINALNLLQLTPYQISREVLGLHPSFNRENQIAEYEPFYFSYELDFRMRVYPSSYFLNPMASKDNKYIVDFSEGEYFFEDTFEIYLLDKFQRKLGHTEVRLIEFFKFYMRLLINNLSKAMSSNVCSGGFLRSLLEYQRFIQSTLEFKSDIVVYLDSSASALQIIHLLFGFNFYQSDVNLTEQTSDTCRKDFYFSLVNEFLLTSNLEKRINKTSLNSLRETFKSAILSYLFGGNLFWFKRNLDEDSSGISFGVINHVSIYDLIDCFWDFIKNVAPIYYLDNFLDSFFDLLNIRAGGVLEWGFGDIYITTGYKKSNSNSLDLNYKIEKNDPIKQKIAFKANFIQSIDALIMIKMVAGKKAQNKRNNRTGWSLPIVPIHDCWGVHAFHSCDISHRLKYVLYDIIRPSVDSGDNKLPWLLTELIRSLFILVVEDMDGLGAFCEGDKKGCDLFYWDKGVVTRIDQFAEQLLTQLSVRFQGYRADELEISGSKYPIYA
jgi:hypothetical protein